MDLGTTSGTASDGGSGQANTNNIALKQDQLAFASLSGLTLATVGTTKSLKIDMQKTTAETSFDDNEFMLIEKTTGINRLRRITKQQLKTYINTNRLSTRAYNQDGVQMIYNGGTNPYYNCRAIANLSTVTSNANGMFVNYGSTGTNPDLRLCSGGTSNQRVATFCKASSGFVGIGNGDTAPAYILDVNGTVNIDGQLNINGTRAVYQDGAGARG